MNRSLLRVATTTGLLLLLTLVSAPAHAASPSLSASRVVAGEKLVLSPVLSGDGQVVVYATSDDDLAGRPLRGVSQLLLQRLGD